MSDDVRALMDAASADLDQLFRDGHAFGTVTTVTRWHQLHADLTAAQQQRADRAFGHGWREGYERGHATGWDHSHLTNTIAEVAEAANQIGHLTRTMDARDAEIASLRETNATLRATIETAGVLSAAEIDALVSSKAPVH